MIGLLFFLLMVSVSFGGQKVQEMVLPNGVKIVLKETTGKGIVSGYVFVRSGTHGEEKRGLTYLTALLLTKGTEKFSSYQIASTFEDYGGSVFSSSADDYVEMGFSTKVEGLEKALEVLRDILLNPSFNEENLQREKNNAIVSIRARRERAQELAMDSLRRITYAGTSYEYAPLGKEEDLQNITREDVLRRWREILKGKNVVVSLVGDIKAQDVKPLLERAFGDIPSGEYSMRAENTYIREDRLEVVKRAGSQATIMCAFNAPNFKSDDYFAFKVLNAVLGEGMTSKLFDELREKKGYAYATYSFYPTRLHSPRLFAYIGTSPDKRDDALKDLLEVVRHAPIGEEDVSIAKGKIVGGFLLDKQTRLRQAWQLGFFEVMGLGWRMDEEYPERIQKVSGEDILRVRGLIDKRHCIVVEP